MSVIHPNSLDWKVKQIFKVFHIFDPWPLSWPRTEGRRENPTPSMDSLSLICYMSVIHPNSLTWKVKEIFNVFHKFDLWPLSWPWKEGRRENPRPSLDSLTLICYMSIIHWKVLSLIISEIFNILWISENGCPAAILNFFEIPKRRASFPGDT